MQAPQALSIFNCIKPALTGNADGPAIIVAHENPDHMSELLSKHKDLKPGSLCLAWTYSEMHDVALRLAVALRAHGIHHLATVLSPGIEWAITLWTSIVLRITHCAIDPGEIWRQETLSRYFDVVRPDAVVVLNNNDAASVDEVMNESHKFNVKLVFDAQSAVPNGWTSVAHFIKDYGGNHVLVEKILAEAQEDDSGSRIARHVFTAGTATGLPKICPKAVSSTAHSLGFLTSQCNALSPSSRSLLCASASRGSASSTALMTWPTGGAVVISAPDAQAVAEAVDKHKVTHVVLSSAQLHELVGLGDFEPARFTSLRAVTLSGDVIKKATYLEATRAFPGAVVVVAYGMAEGGGLFKWPYLVPGKQDIAFHWDVCTVGRMQQSASIKIADAQNDEEVAKGVPGELHVCCESFVDKYADDGHADSFYEQNSKKWFKTGDMALVDDAGMVFILGRMSRGY